LIERHSFCWLTLSVVGLEFWLRMHPRAVQCWHVTWLACVLRVAAQELLTLEEVVPWEMVDAGWRARRPAWRKALRSLEAAVKVPGEARRARAGHVVLGVRGRSQAER
jgi:hypothetical protein